MVRKYMLFVMYSYFIHYNHKPFDNYNIVTIINFMLQRNETEHLRMLWILSNNHVSRVIIEQIICALI